MSRSSFALRRVLPVAALIACSSSPIEPVVDEGTPPDAGAQAGARTAFGVGGAGLPTFADQLRASGAGSLRTWIEWSRIEPRKGEYDWTAMDEVVATANRLNVELLGMFYSMPKWAMNLNDPKCAMGVKGRPPDPCVILDWKDYTDFATAVASRYDGRHGHGEMKYIEIWNEVQGFAGMTADEYGPWLIRGHDAVKQGNPDAQVLLGAVHSPLDFPAASGFIDSMLRDYSRYYDIFNFHTYQPNDGGVEQTIDYMKGRMAAFGVSKPMWITETATYYGKVLCDGLAWRDVVARGVVKRNVQALGNGVDRVFWYQFFGWPTVEEDPTGLQCKEPVNFNMGSLGWVYPKGSGQPTGVFHPRPAYATFQLLSSKLAGFSAVEKKTDTGYEFLVGGKPVHVLWCDSGSCAVPAEISGRVTVTDHTGAARMMDARELVLTASPVFVE